MIEGRPSATARRVAARRAAHQLLDHPRIFDDPLAFAILEPADAAEVRANPQRYDETDGMRVLRTFLAVRSRLAEDLLAESVAAGVTQYVVLGAGLDTFAYRNPFSQVRVFEVDFPATQAWKRERLAQSGIAVPGNATFAPCDFTTQSIGDALRAAGLDATRPTFCSWLGVTMYLERSAVLATIAALVPFIGAPGGLVFDFAAPATGLSPEQARRRQVLAERVARAGEPFRSSFEPGELASAAKTLGCRDVVRYAQAELEARYLAARADGLRLGPIGQMMLVRG